MLVCFKIRTMEYTFVELKEYQQNALRTESIIEKLEFNKQFVIAMLKMAVANSELLDALKKEVYYNNPKKMNENFIRLIDEIENLTFDADDYFDDKDEHDSITLDPRVFHGIIGIATEAGELLTVLVKNLANGVPVDAINVQEELADICWYNAILNDALGLDCNEGLARNIAKLKARYPEKFTTDNANNRNLEVERAILEGQHDS